MDNSSAPQVSVVLPVRNRPLALREAVRSVLRQTWTDFELIIVDDGSTDDTLTAAKALMAEDSRIKVLSVDNGGAARARNLGIRSARGEIIAFQDSDDVWSPDKLARQMSVFDSSGPNVAVVFTEFEPKQPNGRAYRADVPVLPQLLWGNLITTAAAAVRRDALETTGGFDETLPRFQDWELWLRLAQHYEFVGINEALVNVRLSSDSISRNEKALFAALKRILEKHAELFSQDPPARAAVLRRIARSSALLRHTPAGRFHAFAAALRAEARPQFAGEAVLSLTMPPVYRRVLQSRLHDFHR